MTSQILAQCSPQRVIAGIVFIPLLAYSFAPFRDMDLSFPLRIVFWTGVMGLALGATWTASRLVRERLCQSRQLVRDAAFTVLILILFAPSLWGLAWLVFSFVGKNAPSLAAVLPYGGLFAAGLILVRYRKDELPDQPKQRPRLLLRLPESFDGQIYRLTVRDHQVDVVTSEGIFTIRSRFTDAISEMEPEPGHCAHRSHWVATAAISGVEKQGAKTLLRLHNGDLVPVSRKYYPDLEAAGLV